MLPKALTEKVLSIADLLPDDYQNCVHSALNDAIVDWFRELSTDEKTRVVSNMSYHNVFNIIKEEFPDVGETIKNSVIEKINDKSAYSFYVFGYDSLYSTKIPKVGQSIIDKTIRDNADTIRVNTENAISELSKKDIKQFMVNFQYQLKP